MMDERLDRLTELARNAIKEGVNALLASDAADGRLFRESGRDIKLEADLLLSRELTSRLIQTTGIRCMSEEEVFTHSLPEDEPIWIVDPLDGSMNFARGLPLYCVSVALWRAGEPVIGIIYDIERNRILAVHDGEARVDGECMRVSLVTEMGKAVLATGFPLLMDRSPDAIRWFLNFVERFKKVRMLGTAALSMAWVAEGRLDAYFEKDIMVWDVAAGAALVRGAGGVCVMRPGKYPMSLDVLAANPKLAAAVRAVLGW
jgi:myo-inositol-1(or 4)-monophosphatase